MLSIASTSSLTCAATVFFKVKVVLPLRTMGSIKGWLGSCRRSGDNRRQPQQWFHRVCFGGSSGARSPSALLPTASSCPAHQPWKAPGRGWAVTASEQRRVGPAGEMLCCTSTHPVTARCVSRPSSPCRHEVPECCWLHATCVTKLWMPG